MASVPCCKNPLTCVWEDTQTSGMPKWQCRHESSAVMVGKSSRAELLEVSDKGEGSRAGVTGKGDHTPAHSTGGATHRRGRMWALSLPSLPHNHENCLEAWTYPSLPPPVPPPVYHSEAGLPPSSLPPLHAPK